MGDDLTLRPATFDDVPRLLDLSNALDRSWWGSDETDADEIEQRLRMAGDLPAHTRVAETAGRVVGYAVRFARRDTQVMFAPDLAPGPRRRAEDGLLGWLVQVDAEVVDAPAQATGLLAAFARHGFEPTGSSFELERPAGGPRPDAPLPSGVVLRAFDRDLHARAVHALLYRFWAETPTHNDRGFDEWHELFLAHGSFDASQQVVAWRDGRVVAAAICRVYTDDTGWVSQLGVAPEERGQGIGRALLVEAVERLGAVPRVGVVGLSVFARNAGALRLYRSVGFEVTREWVTCERPGDPASG